MSNVDHDRPQLAEEYDLISDRQYEDGIELIEASSFGNFLGHVPDSIRGTFRKDLEAELSKRSTPEGLESTTKTIFAVATKPVHN